MKTANAILITSAIIFLTITSISCKRENRKEAPMPVSNESHQEEVQHKKVVNSGQPNTIKMAIVDEYMSMKDALVADNSTKAAEAGNKLVTAFENFEVSGYSDPEQKELKAIIKNAKEQAGKIAERPMESQRLHFKNLSKNMIDIVSITGTDKKLYEQFCPMYHKGSAWLSSSNEVRNPYYGGEMLTCGLVQREID